MTAPPVPLVELVRGDLREGVHHGSVVVTAPDGSVLHSAGEAHAPMFPRSSNKPAQAVGMLRAGLELADPADLALAASSHNGEPEHVARARDLLSRHGLGEDDLRCPPDWPLRETTRDEYAAGGHGKRRITMNCSGKHAAMLATCAQRGLSTGDYLDPKHPLQGSIHDAVADLAGEPIATGTVDGCGAPLLAVSLTGLARTFARLVTAPEGSPERSVGTAMSAHPWLVAGTEREDTLLMEAVPGLVSKAGAEGVIAVALPDGHAVAAKISDGARRALLPVAVGALRALGNGSVGGNTGSAGLTDAALDALGGLAESPLLGGGEPVGSVRLIPGTFFG